MRRILVVGAHSVLRRAKQNPEKYLWLTQLLARRPFKVVAVALANKMARMAWALLAHGGTYRGVTRGKNAWVCLGPISGSHQGQRPDGRTQRPNT